MGVELPTALEWDAETITFSRVAWDAFVGRLDDAEDIAAIDAVGAETALLGAEEMRRRCVTSGEVRRMADGVSPITIFRERLGLTRRALAGAAGISASYLTEIEGGKKPGSVAAIAAIARALRLPMEMLLP